jgi:hypothetical protein
MKKKPTRGVVSRLSPISKREQEAAHRRAERTGKPVEIKNAAGDVVRTIWPRKKNPAIGKFVKATAVRIRRLGKRFVLDIKR